MRCRIAVSNRWPSGPVGRWCFYRLGFFVPYLLLEWNWRVFLVGMDWSEACAAYLRWSDDGPDSTPGRTAALRAYFIHLGFFSVCVPLFRDQGPAPPGAFDKEGQDEDAREDGRDDAPAGRKPPRQL